VKRSSYVDIRKIILIPSFMKTVKHESIDTCDFILKPSFEAEIYLYPFRVTLGRRTPLGIPVANSPLPSSKIDVKKGRILIVDDDDTDITNSFSLCLEDTGLFEVDTYNDSVKAISNFKDDSYDLALLDIKMPKLNGFELCEKKKRVDGKVKVCFISAFDIDSPEQREIVPSLGIECFIPKPILVKDLIKRIETELLR
jgi:CheY-like chemotaxis protein